MSALYSRQQKNKALPLVLEDLSAFDSVYTHKFKGSKFRKLSLMHSLTLLIRFHNYVMIQNFLFLIHPPQCIAVVSHPTKENEPIIKCETLVIS